MYGEDFDYANTRLAGTIVRLNGKAVEVGNVNDGDGLAHYLCLSDDSEGSVDYRKLDLEPVPLGFINLGGRALYLTRVAKRNDWRQGVRGRTISGLREGYSKEALSRTIEGMYPTFREAKGSIEKSEVDSVAWCREWAVNKLGRLQYKRTVVGKIVGGTPLLINEYGYLQGSLDESITKA